MATLILDLQEGFADDTVIIHINGIEIYHKSGVTTNLAISYADSIQTQVPVGSVNMDINVPIKRLSKTVTLQVANTLYVGISIVDGTLDVQSSNKQFFYM